MKESGNFPMGAAEDPAAPYREETIPELKFDVTISQTLSKTVTVKTDDYIPVKVGNPCVRIHPDTTNTDWRQAYENEHFKIQDLLQELKEYAKSDLAMSGVNTNKGKYLKKLIEACDNWIEDDYEINPE
jgi:hypothetical protein